MLEIWKNMMLFEELHNVAVIDMLDDLQKMDVNYTGL